MGTRKNILKSVNTIKTISRSTRLPGLSSDASLLHRKLDELLNDTTTTTTSTDPLSPEIDYPIPYTFRVLLPKRGAKTNHAKCPPFYMQLDHTIAVLWHVFAHKDKERKKNIGIGQLQWALYFLKGIKDPLEGTRQADIDVAIKSIEDTLIECYAEMANLVMGKTGRKDESDNSSLSTLSLPKQVIKIGTCASLGMMPKPRRSFCHVDDFNVSSLSYTTLEQNTNISTTLKELIKFRNATNETKLEFFPLKKESSTSIKKDDNTSVNDAYEMLKKLREDQVKKLNLEIENLRRLEEAASIRTYFKIILKYAQSFKLWNVVYRIAVVTIRLIFDQFRMDDIFLD